MIEIILLFFFKACTINITAGIGAKFYRLSTNDNDNICFTISTYPFFMIFNEFENTVIYQQYSSSSIDKEYEKTEESLLRFLPVYKVMASPFESVVLKTPVASNISFTIASFPGMCLNGLYLSNKEIDTVIFSKFYEKNGEKKFFKLNEYDDKCLIYSSPFMKQHIKIQMISSNLTNQIFLYSGFNNYFSIYGNSSIEQTTGQSPIIVNNNKKSNLIESNKYETDNIIHLENKINSIVSDNLNYTNDINNIHTVEDSFSPFVIRIIADGKSPPDNVNVTFNVIKENVTNNSVISNNRVLQADWNEGRSGLYLPPQKIESCKEKKTWYSKKVAIIIIVLLFLLFIAFVYIITSNALNNDDESQSEILKTRDNDNNEHNQFESFDASSQTSFFNPPVLKTLVS